MAHEMTMRSRRGHATNVNSSFKRSETPDLSEAYSSIKVLHHELKQQSKQQLKEIKELKEELADYRLRYDELIKLYNTIA